MLGFGGIFEKSGLLKYCFANWIKQGVARISSFVWSVCDFEAVEACGWDLLF